MTQARSELISLDETPYYHCISRCVRRAYLCGDDAHSGNNYDHRKAWLVSRFKELAEVFSIDICAYAVMSNHYHLVLHVDRKRATGWPDDVVCDQWLKLFPGHSDLLTTLKENSNNRAARNKLAQTVALWRERLQDISWFMRCLNEPIARRANREDKCTGRFWEGRFKSQALLDERALICCMAYVDLNPIRAGLSPSLEASDFTSIQERLVTHVRRVKNISNVQKKLLKRFNRNFTAPASPGRSLLRLSNKKVADDNSAPAVIPISRDGYFNLLKETASSLRKPPTKNQIATSHVQFKALRKLDLNAMQWRKTMLSFEKLFPCAAGAPTALLAHHQNRRDSNANLKFANKWVRGLDASSKLFSP